MRFVSGMVTAGGLGDPSGVRGQSSGSGLVAKLKNQFHMLGNHRYSTLLWTPARRSLSEVHVIFCQCLIN